MHSQKIKDEEEDEVRELLQLFFEFCPREFIGELALRTCAVH